MLRVRTILNTYWNTLFRVLYTWKLFIFFCAKSTWNKIFWKKKIPLHPNFDLDSEPKWFHEKTNVHAQIPPFQLPDHWTNSIKMIAQKQHNKNDWSNGKVYPFVIRIEYSLLIHFVHTWHRDRCLLFPSGARIQMVFAFFTICTAIMLLFTLM